MSDPQQAQQLAQQFFQLLPVTMAVAGLPHGEPGKYFNDDQMELRAAAIRKAFKHARKMLKDVVSE